MSNTNKVTIERKLHQKLIALVDQVSTARRELDLTQKELGDGIGMDKGQMSRFLSGRKDIRLETIVRFEDYLGRDLLVTPDDYEEYLVSTPERLKDVLRAAIEEHPTLVFEMPNQVVNYAAIAMTVQSGGQNMATISAVPPEIEQFRKNILGSPIHYVTSKAESTIPQSALSTKREQIGILEDVT